VEYLIFFKREAKMIIRATQLLTDTPRQLVVARIAECADSQDISAVLFHALREAGVDYRMISRDAVKELLVAGLRERRVLDSLGA
jgi:hypothetical protein